MNLTAHKISIFFVSVLVVLVTEEEKKENIAFLEVYMKRLESLYVRQLKAKSIDKQKEMTTKKRLAGKRMSVTSTEGKRIGMKPKEKVNGR